MAHTSSVLMRNYELGRLLGQGTFAKVYYARNTKTGQSVAIKVISKDKVLRAGLMDQIKREISVMRLVKHPNIVRLYEVMATKMKIYFVMEHAKGGELFNKIARGRLKEDAARKYFQQLISAVDYCHSRGVYHRDLKPENILIDEHGNLKVSDFGLSALAESKRQDGLLHTTCGTPAYVAPEVISRKGYDGAKADIWSCGVILFVLLAGFLPFHDSNLMELYRKIGKAEFKCPNWFPYGVRMLLVKILDPDPKTRMPMGSIMENPWVRKGLEKRLVKDGNENTVAVPRDVEEAFTLSNGNADERHQEMAIHKNLNAFDIISLSSGFDLTSLFEEPDHRREARFTSREHATKIISKIEDVAENLRFKVTKKDGGVMSLESQKEGKKGSIEIDAEIFEVMPSYHLVEMRNVGGDSFEYQQIFKEEMQPALEGIVWAWQGDKHPHVSESQPQQQEPQAGAPPPVS